MLRKPEQRRPAAPALESSSGAYLLDEIEAIGRTLSLTPNSPVAPPKSLPPQAPRHRSLSAGKSRFAEPRWKPRAPKREPPPPAPKQKKPSSSTSSSIWNWKPLRALSHIRRRRFDCQFTLHVHSVEGLPPSLHNASLCVHWKRHAAEAGLRTRPALVSHGAAEFEETLEHRCAVYCSRGGGPRRAARYEARQFVVFPAVMGAPDLDLGEHRVDFTRLLPLTLEELEEEASGRWSTTFNLSGKARGASLSVSLGFSLPDGKDMVDSGGDGKASEPPLAEVRGAAEGIGRCSGLRRVGSIPARNGESSGRLRLRSRSVEDIEVVHEVLLTPASEPAALVDAAKLPVDRNCYDRELDNLAHGSMAASNVLWQQENLEKLPGLRYEGLPQQVMMVDLEFDDPEFTVIEQGVEIVAKEGVGCIRDDLGERGELKKVDKVVGKLDLEDNAVENNIVVAETITEELESAFQGLSIFESVGLKPLVREEAGVPEQMSYKEAKSNYKAGKANKSLSLDNVAESVASEFLSMLGIEHSPVGFSSESDQESPRESLWKQFKREFLSKRESLFGVDMERREGLDWKCYNEDFGLFPVVHAAETDHQETNHTMKSKTKARMLEDAEAEALMHEWGLSERAFEGSPPGSASGFGSPIELPPDDPLDLPSLGDGLGSLVQTQDGGFLRSMSPSLFRNSENNGSLIMQVSRPMVVPAEMGSSIMEILQHLASVGIENLSMQASKMMPLEDIAGKTVQQVAWEACERQASFEHFKAEVEWRLGRNAAGKSNKTGKILNPSSYDYVSLEGLTPLAVEKIEALTIEGLRIQSGMSDVDAPLSISPRTVGEISALNGKGTKNWRSLGLEDAAGLQLLDVKERIDDVDGLLGLSITLDEWMKLDSGIKDEEGQISDRTFRILAAHHANFAELVTGGSEGEREGGRNYGRKRGFLGSNLTEAMMVQLRDPLRNYEPVGMPMLALIQVERSFIPSKPKICGTVSGKGNSEEDDELGMELKSSKEEKNDGQEEVIPQFKITDVHVAGMKTDPGKKRFWGNAMQQQSGSRWLLANGMGKNNKHPFLKSMAIVRPLQGTTEMPTTIMQPGDMLWSISSHVHGTGAKWKELAALNPHIRNPNIIIPNEMLRLR